MKIYLSFNNGKEGFILPINPASIEVLSPHFNERKRLINLGEINLIGKRGLSSLTLSSFFPSEKSAFRSKADRSAYEYVELIKKWKETGKPIRVILSGADFNMAMLIDEFNFTLLEGREDIIYSLKLSEYRFLNVEVLKNDSKVQVKNGLKKRPDVRNVPKTYIVKSGDNLWKISKRLLGDGSKFKSIYMSNKVEMDKRNKKASKYTVYIGQRLVVDS